jgi:hypothetical protein
MSASAFPRLRDVFLFREPIDESLFDLSKLVCAAALFASPWAFEFSDLPAWNLWSCGYAILVVTAAALMAEAEWEPRANFCLGAWVLASPWMLGFTSETGATVLHLAGGSIVVGLSALELWGTQRNPPWRFQPGAASRDTPAVIAPEMQVVTTHRQMPRTIAVFESARTQRHASSRRSASAPRRIDSRRGQFSERLRSKGRALTNARALCMISILAIVSSLENVFAQVSPPDLTGMYRCIWDPVPCQANGFSITQAGSRLEIKNDQGEVGSGQLTSNISVSVGPPWNLLGIILSDQLTIEWSTGTKWQKQ